MKYEHGTHACYVIDRCRCQPCRAANRGYERERARRLEPAYVAAGPARAHIAELSAAGVGLKTIAKVSGVSHGALWKLVYGLPGRGPSKRVRKATLDAILAVTPRDAADGARTAAAPTLALIAEMVAAGVPKVRIAEAIGQTGPGLQLGADTVTNGNARAVAALYTAWKAGELTIERRSRYGSSPVPAPPPVRRERADVSDLLTALAEVVELRNSQPWRASAACRARPIYLWFPARGDARTLAKGRAICDACTVRAQCRAEMFTERDGVYGGLSARARREVIRQDRIPA